MTRTETRTDALSHFRKPALTFTRASAIYAISPTEKDRGSTGTCSGHITSPSLIVTGYIPMDVTTAGLENLRPAAVVAVHTLHGGPRTACKGGMTQKTTLCNHNTIITRRHQKCVELTNAKMAMQKEETGQVIAGRDHVYITTKDRISPRVNGQKYNRAIRH
jgi:hypothetical protein